MLPIAAAWKVTYERLPADADIKTVTEVTSIRAKWRAAASTLAWTLERAYKKAGKPVPAWVTEKKNATAPAWLLPEFNGTVPDGMPNIDLPKDQAIQQTIAGNGGLFAPKQAAEIAATEVYINAVTNDAPPAGSYRQVRERGMEGWFRGVAARSIIFFSTAPPPSLSLPNPPHSTSKPWPSPPTRSTTWTRATSPSPRSSGRPSASTSSPASSPRAPRTRPSWVSGWIGEKRKGGKESGRRR